MIRTYRHRPNTVEAEQFDGETLPDMTRNLIDVRLVSGWANLKRVIYWGETTNQDITVPSQWWLIKREHGIGIEIMPDWDFEEMYEEVPDEEKKV